MSVKERIREIGLMKAVGTGGTGHDVLHDLLTPPPPARYLAPVSSLDRTT